MEKNRKGSRNGGESPQQSRTDTAGTRKMTLADLPVGTTATIVKVMPEWRGRKKFADVGVVAGSELLMEAHAPFGGLLRVRILETSMAMHRDDAKNIMLQSEESAK